MYSIPVCDCDYYCIIIYLGADFVVKMSRLTPVQVGEQGTDRDLVHFHFIISLNFPSHLQIQLGGYYNVLYQFSLQ